jgi:hypothetical protein
LPGAAFLAATFFFAATFLAGAFRAAFLLGALAFFWAVAILELLAFSKSKRSVDHTE